MLMNKNYKNGVVVYSFENLELPEIKHFISTRGGGVSKEPYNSLNLGLHVDDDTESVLENRKILAAALDTEPDRFVMLKQVHSGEAVFITKKDRGRGTFDYAEAIDGADALITNSPDIYLMVQVADCVSVLLFDPVQKVVAAVHAGWRGTMKQISKSTVLKMQEEFHCEPQNIIAGIGPSIGPCCFESEKEDLLEKWKEMYSEEDKVIESKDNRTFINLWQANKIQLMRLGVEEKNIEVAGVCTCCNTDEFYSYKKESLTGRFGAGIMLT